MIYIIRLCLGLFNFIYILGGLAGISFWLTLVLLVIFSPYEHVIKSNIILISLLYFVCFVISVEFRTYFRFYHINFMLIMLWSLAYAAGIIVMPYFLFFLLIFVAFLFLLSMNV